VFTLIKKVYKTTDEEFAAAVEKSISIRDCLLRLNLIAAGGNYRSFHSRVKKLGLSIAHFIDPKQWNSGKKFGPKRPIEDYLVKGRHCSSNSLRRRLISEGLKEAKCECCGIVEWNNQPAPLELDHINGNHEDNRLENLQILCPNCHAQTETYRGRNRADKKKKAEKIARIKKEKEVKPSYDHNALKKDEVEERLKKISHIDLGKFGWVQKVADALNLTHTQARRFIKKYYSGEVYTRNSPSK
jgi:Zn finger protein HypA/HybF involved in hydrogenase expression